MLLIIILICGYFLFKLFCITIVKPTVLREHYNTNYSELDYDNDDTEEDDLEGEICKETTKAEPHVVYEDDKHFVFPRIKMK